MAAIGSVPKVYSFRYYSRHIAYSSFLLFLFFVDKNRKKSSTSFLRTEQEPSPKRVEAIRSPKRDISKVRRGASCFPALGKSSSLLMCEIEILSQTITTGRIIVWGGYLVLGQIYSLLTMSQEEPRHVEVRRQCRNSR